MAATIHPLPGSQADAQAPLSDLDLLTRPTSTRHLLATVRALYAERDELREQIQLAAIAFMLQTLALVLAMIQLVP